MWKGLGQHRHPLSNLRLKHGEKNIVSAAACVCVCIVHHHHVYCNNMYVCMLYENYKTLLSLDAILVFPTSGPPLHIIYLAFQSLGVGKETTCPALMLSVGALGVGS